MNARTRTALEYRSDAEEYDFFGHTRFFHADRSTSIRPGHYYFMLMSSGSVCRENGDRGKSDHSDLVLNM
jgi:hypothetical protein